VDLTECWEFHTAWLARSLERRRANAKAMGLRTEPTDNQLLSFVHRRIKGQLKIRAKILSLAVVYKDDDDFIQGLIQFRTEEVNMVLSKYDELHPFYQIAWDMMILLQKWKQGEVDWDEGFEISSP